MTNKGERKKIKALNAPKASKIKRKENKWTITTKAGAHKREDSVALGIVLRDLIKIAENLKEAKQMLYNGEVKLNGKIVKEYQQGIGLFDVIELEKQEEQYRTVFDKKRRLVMKKLNKNTNEKISKIVKKIQTKKGIQITTDDGKTFFNDKINVNDSVKIKFPENKIEEILPLKKGAIVYITKGTHCSEKGQLKEIGQGTMKRTKTVIIAKKDKDIETIIKNMIVIGEKSVAIADLKEI